METDQIDSLYRRFGPIIFRRCRSLLGSETDALDALQDVFEKLHHAIGGFRGDAEIMTWIYRIATNVCLNRIRRGQIEKRVIGRLEAEESRDPRPRIETSLLLAQLLERLPPDRVQLLIYVHHDGLSQEEIARLLGVSSRTIRKRLSQVEHLAQEWRGASE